MAGLRRYTGNRLEILAGQLAELIRHPLSSPLNKEIIVVQIRGMGPEYGPEFGVYKDRPRDTLIHTLSDALIKIDL